MTERSILDANRAAENAEARAPLSSYLRDGTQACSQDGWTIFSSDGESKPTRAPNLSVLKQIKNFLNAKSGDAKVPFDSNSQKFRVDYPYYAPDTEIENQESSRVEEVSFTEPDYATPSTEDETPNVGEIEREPRSNEELFLPSGDVPEVIIEKSVPIPCENDLETNSEPEASDEQCESENKAVALATSDSLEGNVLICSSDDQEETENASVSETTSSDPRLLDVAEIIGGNFSDVEESASLGEVESENEPLEPISEERFDSTAEPSSTRGSEEVAPCEKPRNAESLAIVDAPRYEIRRREKNGGRLSIFRRFVDLATTRRQIDADSLDVDENREENVEPSPQEYPREICVCDAFELANSMEVVGAPYYVGANMTFQN